MPFVEILACNLANISLGIFEPVIAFQPVERPPKTPPPVFVPFDFHIDKELVEYFIAEYKEMKEDEIRIAKRTHSQDEFLRGTYFVK